MNKKNLFKNEISSENIKTLTKDIKYDNFKSNSI